MITSVTYGRTYNQGNYENLRLEVTVTVTDNVAAAFDEAIAAVEQQHARMIGTQAQQDTPRTGLLAPQNIPATDKQRNYIARLMDDLGWTSEQLAVYAQEQEVDLVAMTRTQASTFIDGLKKLAMQNIPF